jgi:hypothetical protein
MTNRERIEAILQGMPPDKIPWLPRLELWYSGHVNSGTLPPEFQGLSLREIERKLGLGTPARQARVFTQSFMNLDFTREQNGGREITTFHTPFGKVRQVFSRSALTQRLGYDGMWTEFPVKSAADLPAIEYVIAHMEFESDFKSYVEYDEEIGEDGFPMVVAGLDPFHEILLRYTGYEAGYLLLHTHHGEFEKLLALIAEKFSERDNIILNSPAKLICVGQHFDGQMTPPPVFKKYFLPYYQQLSAQLHGYGKKLACHADADLTGLLELVKEAGFDMAECYTCAPMVSCTLEQTRCVWGEDVIIWGGIPSTLITSAIRENDFRQYVNDLFRIIAPGKAFILGIGDNVMPEAIWDRILYLNEVIEKRGNYPVGL